jgi:redox-sensitive bicupin YhaK (pirin superfamily)
MEPDGIIGMHQASEDQLLSPLKKGWWGTVCCVRTKRAHNTQYPFALFAGHSLFIVIQGTGRVRSEESEHVAIGEGDIVLWQSGEMHETASGPDGLRAIVMEGPSLGENLLIG